jgi:hypothetical protein
MIVKNGRKAWERTVWVSAGGEISLNAVLESAAVAMPPIGNFEAENGSVK